MNCPFCAAENGTKANYCSSCGSPLHLRVCRHCDAVNDKTAIACINCGGALVAETALSAGPAVATRVPATLAVMSNNVIDLDVIGCACADNDRRENHWPRGGWERTWPGNIRPENIWQQTNRAASGAEVERLLRHIDEEIHRLEARARAVSAAAPRAALPMSVPGAKPRAAAPPPKLFNPQLATNGGTVETQRFSWRRPVLFVVSISIGIASYLSLPPEPSTMLAASDAGGKRIGRGIAALPPDSKAMTAIALVRQPAKFDRAIATRSAVVPQTRANLPARPDNPLASPLGELAAAKVQGKPALPESAAAAGFNKAGNGRDVHSVQDVGNPPGSQTMPMMIATASNLAIRADSVQPKPLRASSKTSRRNAMLRASLQADVAPVRRQLY